MRQSEIKKGPGGVKGKSQENSFSPLLPLTIALSVDAQVPGGISRENVRPEINLPANLCEEGELYTIIP